MGLLIISTHPIQYHAPIYRYLARQLGVDVTVLYGSDQGVSQYHDKEFAMKFAWDTDLLSDYKSLFLSRVQAKAAFTPKLEVAMDNFKPSAVMLLGYSEVLYQKAWCHARQQKIPILFRMEANDVAYKTTLLKRALRDYLLKKIYRTISAFMYIGVESMTHYRRLGVPEHKLFFSPYCIDAANFQSGEEDHSKSRKIVREELGISAQDIVAVFSGKFIERKNPEVILKALMTLPGELQRQIVIMYIGSGPLKPLLERTVQEEGNVRVIFCGFKNQSELSAYYNAADFMILPSRKEPWGLVVNEAMVHGLPCVVSDHVACHKDLIEPGVTGEVFVSNDKNDLGRAITKIVLYCKSPSTQQICRRKVSNYSVEAAANGIAKAYQHITSIQIGKEPSVTQTHELR